ncbi:unnamed protein product [Porites lobata]|uniref:Dynactin subunit 2 n=1 Tax=Porites lobata TaxID=104759 RepID=A0ABN8PBH8_9CNID|nr:unnamed protein product [Porites lobata]
MALRSKYSDLPGIDNQPDVFETPDIVEKSDEVDGSSVQNGDENVHLLKIDTSKAFEKFSGKYLDSTDSARSIESIYSAIKDYWYEYMSSSEEFSDTSGEEYLSDDSECLDFLHDILLLQSLWSSIAILSSPIVANPCVLYFSGQSGPRQMRGYVTKTEYEMLGDGTTKETPQNKFNRLQHEIRELAEELEHIKDTMQDEKEEKKLSPVVLVQEVQTLQKQLEDLHLVNVLGKEALTVASTPQAGLSERLQTQLEAFKSSAITTDLEIKEKNLLAAASALEAKVALLDANHIEHVDARLQGILHHISALSEKKGEAENSAKENKVSELYDLLNKWDSFVDVVPDLITRLQTLKALHEQAGQFGQSLLQLDSSQSTLKSQMQDQAKLLNELEASFTANVAAIEANCARVEARMNALLEKFETKGR